MIIGYVLDESLDKPDGVQQYVLNIGAWMKARGHEVHYIVGESHRTDLENLHSMTKNLQVKFNQNRLSTPFPASRPKIKALFAAHKFDVLHVQMPYSPMMAGRIISLAPKHSAVVGSFHILPYSKHQTYANQALGLWLRRNAKRFDSINGVSLPAAVFATKTLGREAGVMPNVVNVEEMSKGRKIAAYGDGKLNIVFLGRLVERKGCIELLRAIKLLNDHKKLGNVRLVVCGKGPLAPSLHQYVHQNGLSEVVEFVGFISEESKADYLSTADIAVFPSLGGESFGIVLIEAMAAGSRVVIAGNNPGYASVMGDHASQLVDPTNTQALANTLEHFLQDEAAKLAAYRWQTSEVKRFDINKVGLELESLYSSSVAKRNPRTDNTIR